MAIRSQLKDQEMVQMMIKNPSLEQTGGPREEGSKTQRKSASQSAPVEEVMQTTRIFEAPAHQEFDTGVQDEQAEEEVQHLPDWFQQPARLLIRELVYMRINDKKIPEEIFPG
ncbi:hypothetical protein Tco_1128969, partial [Tanacetum coccineum]